MSGGQTDKQIQMLQDFRPAAILATPTYLLTISDAMKRKGLDQRDTSLRTAVLGAEPWSEQMRGEIEDLLVFTSLIKQALPIIRYRTRDLTRLLPGSVRSAGTTPHHSHRHRVLATVG